MRCPIGIIGDRPRIEYVTAIQNGPTPSAGNITEDYVIDPNSNKLSSKGVVSYTYDAVGNMTSDGTLTFTYDELNRITQVDNSNGTVATYGYDSSNRRIIKTVGSVTTHYIYDSGSQLIAETQADGSVNREYIYLDGEVIAVKEYQSNPGLYFYINDHLGTPQRLIQADGTVVWAAAYLPFGLAQISTETVKNNIRFPGQYFDSETGLHYNWHRFYDPSTGRYITADPIGLAGGINLYAYVQGNPVNWIDPWGLMMGDWANYKDLTPEERNRRISAWVKRRDERLANWMAYDEARRKAAKELNQCILECMMRKLPYIGAGEIIAWMGGAVLSSTGVGALGVASYNLVTESATVYELYNAYNQCKNEDCNQCEVPPYKRTYEF